VIGLGWPISYAGCGGAGRTAPDTPPVADPGQSRERQEARAEFIREYDKGELHSIDEEHPFPPTRYE